MSTNPHKPGGFTLIEVLIALAIAGLGLAVILGATGVGLQNGSIADQYIQATRHAQSHLAQVGVTVPLKEGDYSGDDGDGFGWQVNIATPQIYAPVSNAPVFGTLRPGAQDTGPKPLPLALYPVSVRVRWRSGIAWREVALRSERTGPP